MAGEGEEGLKERGGGVGGVHCELRPLALQSGDW